MNPFAAPKPDDWHDHVACADTPTDVFFSPTRGPRPEYPAAATQACARCPVWVKAACLAEALAYPEEADQGFRAGLTPDERHRLRKARRRAS